MTSFIDVTSTGYDAETFKQLVGHLRPDPKPARDTAALDKECKMKMKEAMAHDKIEICLMSDKGELIPKKDKPEDVNVVLLSEVDKNDEAMVKIKAKIIATMGAILFSVALAKGTFSEELRYWVKFPWSEKMTKCIYIGFPLLASPGESGGWGHAILTHFYRREIEKKLSATRKPMKNSSWFIFGNMGIFL